MGKSSFPSYNRIKAVLAETKHTNIELATYLGVYPQTVSKWCTNVKQPSIERLYQIAKFLEVEMGDLLTKRKDIRDI
jgi:DNA-binding Xre family transcriptional regulator